MEKNKSATSTDAKITKSTQQTQRRDDQTKGSFSAATKKAVQRMIETEVERRMAQTTTTTTTSTQPIATTSSVFEHRLIIPAPMFSGKEQEEKKQYTVEQFLRDVDTYFGIVNQQDDKTKAYILINVCLQANIKDKLKSWEIQQGQAQITYNKVQEQIRIQVQTNNKTTDELQNSLDKCKQDNRSIEEYVTEFKFLLDQLKIRNINTQEYEIRRFTQGLDSETLQQYTIAKSIFDALPNEANKPLQTLEDVIRWLKTNPIVRQFEADKKEHTETQFRQPQQNSQFNNNRQTFSHAGKPQTSHFVQQQNWKQNSRSQQSHNQLQTTKKTFSYASNKPKFQYSNYQKSQNRSHFHNQDNQQSVAHTPKMGYQQQHSYNDRNRQSYSKKSSQTSQHNHPNQNNNNSYDKQQSTKQIEPAQPRYRADEWNRNTVNNGNNDPQEDPAPPGTSNNNPSPNLQNSTFPTK
jgi:hypothetical protein